jgi:hypothetical protein
MRAPWPRAEGWQIGSKRKPGRPGGRVASFHAAIGCLTARRQHASATSHAPKPLSVSGRTLSRALVARPRVQSRRQRVRDAGRGGRCQLCRRGSPRLAVGADPIGRSRRRIASGDTRSALRRAVVPAPRRSGDEERQSPTTPRQTLRANLWSVRRSCVSGGRMIAFAKSTRAGGKTVPMGCAMGN